MEHEGAIRLGDDARVHLAPDGPVDVGPLRVEAEAVLHDTASAGAVLLGARRVSGGGGAIEFKEPVDVAWHDGAATCFAPHPIEVTEQHGMRLEGWHKAAPVNPRSHGDYQCRLVGADQA